MTNPLSPEPAPVRAEMIERLKPAFITCTYANPDYFVTIKSPTPGEATAWHHAVLDLAKASPQSVASVASDDAKDKQIAALKRDLAIKDALFSVEAEQHVTWMERYLALEAELARLKAGTEDGERWRALMSSGKLHFMGCAGFEFTNSVEGSRALATSTATPRRGEDMHFGMEFWAEAKAGPDYPDNFERSLMVVYVDEIRRRNLTRST